jgi:predicted alpha-1,2-mannosidase
MRQIGKFTSLRRKLIFCVLIFSGVTTFAQTKNLASFVDPFVGTDRAGDTFPGAVAPYGSVQMNPNWAGNGYRYRNTHMHGFVVNSMSGNGGSDEGQVLITATTGDVKVDRQSTDFQFDHQHEAASAGYYDVLMQPWAIQAKLTATIHCGFIQFKFPAGKQANILLPLSYANTIVHSSHVHSVDRQTIEGDVTSESFNGAREGITVYFVMSLSKPFAEHGTWTNDKIAKGGMTASQNDLKTVIGFYGSYPASADSQEVDVRIGVSYTDLAGARANLKAEMPENNFERYHQQTVQDWNKELSAIEVDGGTTEHNRTFYTALYHCLLAPQIFDDVDGRYRGYDEKIHRVPEGHKHFYVTFSGWDIYRSEIPLLALIAPERSEDMAQSLVEMYKQIGYIDRWPERNRATTAMGGNPLTIAMVHIWNAGLHHFDINTAYEAMFKQTGPGDIHGYIGDYELYEEEKHGVTINPDAAVATALEFDVSFAALGNLAKSLDKDGDASFLYGRSLQYREMYNPVTGFLQRRNKFGSWDPGMGGYTEGNEWIYLWFVPHDVQGLVDLLGGTAAFDQRLDAFFDGKHYDAGNEPDIQAPFLYDYINRPWKTQHIVAETADKEFTDTPGGLAGGGNDDLGTMSAWYILSQIGFYPVDPGIPDFEVCTPRFKRIVIHFNPPYTGKEFVIQAPDAAPENEYIQSAELNGAPLTQPWFHESAITGGGTWSLKLGPKPNTDWAALTKDRPYSLSTGYNHFPQHPILRTLVPTSQDKPQLWRYTTDDPGSGWSKADFNDQNWKEGHGPFGSGSRNSQPGTAWNTNQIWMRRTFTLPEFQSQIALLMSHKQSTDVYINGVLAVTIPGVSNSYTVFPLTPESVKVLHAGANEIVIHAYKDFGSQIIDTGIVEVQWPDSEE